MNQNSFALQTSVGRLGWLSYCAITLGSAVGLGALAMAYESVGAPFGLVIAGTFIGAILSAFQSCFVDANRSKWFLASVLSYATCWTVVVYLVPWLSKVAGPVVTLALCPVTLGLGRIAPMALLRLIRRPESLAAQTTVGYAFCVLAFVIVAKRTTHHIPGLLLSIVVLVLIPVVDCMFVRATLRQARAGGPNPTLRS